LKNKDGFTVFDLIQKKEDVAYLQQKLIIVKATKHQKYIKESGISLKRKLSNVINSVPVNTKKVKLEK
jgi:hypothetical protein